MPEYPVRSKSLVFSTAVALVMTLTAVDAHAGEADLYLFGEYVTWREFDADGTTRILKETGPLAGIGYAYHGRVPSGESFYDEGAGRGAALTLTPRIELFGGKLDYDGQACDLSGTCAPATTETGLAGGKVEFDLGIADDRAFQLELFVGAGVRGWVRTVRDNPDNAGLPVEGYAERWISSYSRLGMRAEFGHESSRFFFEATAKRALSNTKTIYMSDIQDYLDDVTVKPGEESSVFCEIGLKVSALKISAFYETLRYSESPHVLKYNAFLGAYLDFWQPAAEAEMYGLRIGAAF